MEHLELYIHYDFFRWSNFGILLQQHQVLNGLVYVGVPDLSKFCAVSYGSSNTMTSTDGVTWYYSSTGVHKLGKCMLRIRYWKILCTFNGNRSSDSSDGISLHNFKI